MREPLDARTSLPTGAVAILFTDIEGSTALWEHDRTQMSQALRAHDVFARTSVESHRGTVVKMTGDGMHAVFDDSLDALAATVDLQLALADPIRTSGVALRVRCGLHAGMVERRDNDYFGSSVNRAARIMSAAHGGQVLISQAMVDSVREGLPAAFSLRDLGRVRLKDLSTPEHVYQVVHVDLRTEFPALRSLEATPNNLPQQATSFIGREKELAELKRLLPKTRLLTLTGSGGCGKTRLSLQVAADSLERFPDGVWLVELAPLADPTLVAQTVAGVLGLKEALDNPSVRTLTAHLKDQRLLLLLDNCEHLLDGCAALADTLLRQCPQVTMLASSREALRIGGEQAYRVPSLSLPDPKQADTAAAVMLFEAVQLFSARGQLARLDFQITDQNAASLASICRRLDGIPLAIELAAARVRSLSIEEIDRKLDQRFLLLTGGARTALPRQQTLRAALEWSHALLTDAEQSVFRRLSVFAGGFPLELAQEVASDEAIDKWQALDHLAALVDKSLVVVDTGDPPRYRMLETSRVYAMEQLVVVGERDRIASRHAHGFAALFEAAWAERWTARSADDSFARLKPELDNLRTALDWSSRNDPELEIGLAGAAAWLWLGSGLDAEGIAACERAISHLSTKTAPTIEARLLSELAQLGWYMLPLERALQALERAIALYREANDSVGLYLALARKAGFLASCGDIERARRALVEMEGLETGNWPLRLRLERLIAKTRVVVFAGTSEEFQAAHEERYHLASVLGSERDQLLARGNLVLWKVGIGQLEEAIRDGRLLVDQFRQHGIAGAYLGYLLSHVAMALALSGRLREALPLLREAAPALRAGAMVWRLLDLFALIALLRGRKDDAARLFGAGAAIFKRIGRKREIVLDRLHDVVSDQLRDAHAPEALAHLLRESEAMSEGEAVVAALHELASGD
ncbi:MAG: adenylate/guanylate cyclase domain-containing protein [Steroidobacteraceae bacterium]